MTPTPPTSAPRPYNLVAELTYRCPLRCTYCSNPVGFRDVKEGLDAATWSRVFAEAAALGVVHVGLTGGEPTVREDLVDIVAAARDADLYSHLITAGTPIDEAGLDALCEAGLCSVQLSFQDAEPEPSDRVAGVEVFERKLEFAARVRERSLALATNFVLHRDNLGRVRSMIELSRRLGAHRVELANAQYHGWALVNRDALLPTREQIEEASRAVEQAVHGRLGTANDRGGPQRPGPAVPRGGRDRGARVLVGG
jgi:pyrroloquinoline quinone biosynthesis protein E